MTFPLDGYGDGEWIQPILRHYLLACCDCGLTHRLNFRIRGGRTQFQAFRDPVSTRRQRKAAHVLR